MERLKTTGRSSDKRLRRGVNLVVRLENHAGTEGDQVADLQRAVELDQTNEQAWDLLIINLLGAGSQEQLLEVCERRLKSGQRPQSFDSRQGFVSAKAL